MRNKATLDQVAGIDEEIARLNDLKTAFEQHAHSKVGVEQIKTYKQLDDELQYYSGLLKTATDTERVQIQQQINALGDLKKQWDDTLAALKVPEDITRLNTIEKLYKMKWRTSKAWRVTS